jgi:small-conductance mechanosensitive channel
VINTVKITRIYPAAVCTEGDIEHGIPGFETRVDIRGVFVNGTHIILSFLFILLLYIIVSSFEAGKKRTGQSLIKRPKVRSFDPLQTKKHMKKMKIIKIALIVLFAGFLMAVPFAKAGDKTDIAAKNDKPSIGISKEMGEVMFRQTSKVKEEFKEKARSLFERRPLGWDLNTLDYLYDLALSWPGKIPAFTRFVIEQSKVLGVIGSILVLLFFAAVFYSLLGQHRVVRWVTHRIEPMYAYIPEAAHPFFISGIKVMVSALIPLLLLAAYALINAMINYSEAWFQLTGRLLRLWAAGALLLRLLKESLTRNLFEATSQHGRAIYRWARLALLYAIFGMAAYWTAEAFDIREDVLALLRFAISGSITLVLLMLFLNKKAFMSLLPELPVQSYRQFRRFLERYYFPLLIVSFLAALLWCFGYMALGRLVLVRIWFSVVMFVFIMFFYHTLSRSLNNWFLKLDSSDETALMLARALKSLLKYATVVATLTIILYMLGLLNPLRHIMSFPIFQLGNTAVTFWLIVRAMLILMAVVYISRLAQAYFDYKVYPSFGIDPGLGYAVNTIFKYVCLGIGFLIALNIIGINLRFFLVFAGAIGVGVGFGLQNMAANVISGFAIIFGGKIRKGDWIQVENMMGEITAIHLRATMVRTRDNIEYLVPNSNIISNTMVNYSLSSSLIRITLPVGVSYHANPRDVEKILLAAAENEPLVHKNRRPEVRFITYADSSINFELLIWIDVRKTPPRKVRSNLYFVIFDELAKAGIEIPFPQRDVHIRSRSD